MEAEEKRKMINVIESTKELVDSRNAFKKYCEQTKEESGDEELDMLRCKALYQKFQHLMGKREKYMEALGLD